MSSLEILGILSAFLTLCAFILNQYGFLSNDDIRYDAMNMFAGAGLFAYAYSIHGIPFMLTNAVWATVSAIDVARYFWHRAKAGK